MLLFNDISNESLLERTVVDSVNVSIFYLEGRGGGTNEMSPIFKYIVLNHVYSLWHNDILFKHRYRMFQPMRMEENSNDRNCTCPLVLIVLLFRWGAPTLGDWSWNDWMGTPPLHQYAKCRSVFLCRSMVRGKMRPLHCCWQYETKAIKLLLQSWKSERVCFCKNPAIPFIARNISF